MPSSRTAPTRAISYNLIAARIAPFAGLSGRLLDGALEKARVQARALNVPAPISGEEVRAAIHRAAESIRVSSRNPSPFRLLNEAEITAIDNWAARGKLGEDPEILHPVTPSETAGAPLTPGQDPPLLLRDYLRVSYHRTQGGFTICTLSFRYLHPNRGGSHEIRTGASRRSFKDPYNPIKGEMLALFRAVRAQAVTLP